jgi:hypothetical protein
MTKRYKEWGWVKENPVKMASREKEALHKDRRLTDSEERRLPKVCPERLKNIIVFAIDTGRRGVKFSLCPGDVSTFKKRWLSQTSERRGVPLTRRVRDILALRQDPQKAQSLQDNLVFCNAAGLAVNIHGLRWALKIALKEEAPDKLIAIGQ